MLLESKLENGVVSPKKRQDSNSNLNQNGQHKNGRRRKFRSNSLFTSGVLGEYLHNSSIHGCKELGRTDKSGLRGFWATVIVLCMVGVSYEIYQIINYYSGKPGATQISWNVRDSYDYPPIAFCPKRWLRMERAKKLGLTDDLLAYAVSLIQFDVKVSEDFDEERARTKLLEIMGKNNMTSYLDLIIAIGYESENLLRIMSTPSEIRLTPFVPSFGLCYLMELKPILANTLRTSMLLRLAYKPPHRMNTTQLYDRRLQPHMLVRDSSGVKPNFITFSQTAIYQIDFEAQVYRRISRRNKPCLTELPDKDYHVGMCELMCIQKEKARRGCDACYNIGLMATLNMTPTPDKRPCHNFERIQSTGKRKRREAGELSLENSTKSLDAEVNSEPTNIPHSMSNDSTSSTSMDGESLQKLCSANALAEGTAACTAECRPPCEQWVYKHTTNLLSDESGDEIVVWVAYNPIDGILWYEEVPTYTADTLISNIGGQLGLWLGASVISVIQIIYYCCLSAWKRRQTFSGSTMQKQSTNMASSTGTLLPGEKEQFQLV